MKILFVITGLGMGGAEHVVVNLADELVLLGHNVKIAYLTGEVIVCPKSPDVQLISIGVNNSKDFLKAYTKLRSIVRKFRPDVVHSHMFHSIILSRILRLSVKIPKLVTTVHNTNENGKNRMLAYRLTDYLTDISTNVSEESVEAYIRKKAVKQGRMISIPNGIDTEYFCFNENSRKQKRLELNIRDKKLILCVGSLTKQKDYPNLFKAIAVLKDERQDFKVVIVGDGPLKNYLETLSKNLNIEEYVDFIGIRRDVKELMSAADIYVMSSAWEGLPMVILEAMACECFVVATDCGGIRKTIGSSGIIIEANNYKQLSSELAKTLNMSVEDRSIIGVAARQRIIDGYSLNMNVKSYLNLYESKCYLSNSSVFPTECVHKNKTPSLPNE